MYKRAEDNYLQRKKKEKQNKIFLFKVISEKIEIRLFKICQVYLNLANPRHDRK